MPPSEIQIEFDPALHVFLATARRRGPSAVRVDGSSTLGHLVESLGVPLTEVGSLRMDGEITGPMSIPQGGETLVVGPISRPQRVDVFGVEVRAAGSDDAVGGTVAPMRFLLDIHLGTLARRLRMLGVDTAYENPDIGDAALAARSAAERRILLSRDRGLLMRREIFAGAYIYSNRTADQVDDVLSRFAPELAPWTRCTACNGPLRDATKESMRDRLPAGTARSFDVFAQCAECGQAYWRGAHHARLQALIDDSVRKYGGSASRS